jgi:hypothetical protein
VHRPSKAKAGNGGNHFENSRIVRTERSGGTSGTGRGIQVERFERSVAVEHLERLERLKLASFLMLDDSPVGRYGSRQRKKVFKSPIRFQEGL